MIQILLAVIYLAFISLGLPDSLLGSAWPSMYPEFGVPVSWAGVVSMIIAAGTIVSSLQSDRLTRRLGAGKVLPCLDFLFQNRSGCFVCGRFHMVWAREVLTRR